MTRTTPTDHTTALFRQDLIGGIFSKRERDRAGKLDPVPCVNPQPTSTARLLGITQGQFEDTVFDESTI